VAQYPFKFLARQSAIVIRYDCDLPWLEPTLLATVLPVDLRVVGHALVFTTPRISAGRRLASHEMVPGDCETFYVGRPSALGEPRH